MFSGELAAFRDDFVDTLVLYGSTGQHLRAQRLEKWHTEDFRLDERETGREEWHIQVEAQHHTDLSI